MKCDDGRDGLIEGFEGGLVLIRGIPVGSTGACGVWAGCIVGLLGVRVGSMAGCICFSIELGCEDGRGGLIVKEFTGGLIDEGFVSCLTEVGCKVGCKDGRSSIAEGSTMLSLSMARIGIWGRRVVRVAVM